VLPTLKQSHFMQYSGNYKMTLHSYSKGNDSDISEYAILPPIALEPDQSE